MGTWYDWGDISFKTAAKKVDYGAVYIILFRYLYYIYDGNRSSIAKGTM